jgi:transcriptional regulator with XRE-family HTH domain
MMAPVENRVRHLRLARGLALRRLAREAGIDPTSLSRIERGGGRATAEQALRLARLLGTTVEEAFGPAPGDSLLFRSAGFPDGRRLEATDVAEGGLLVALRPAEGEALEVYLHRGEARELARVLVRYLVAR